jgi:Methylamine utilisation protein MauE
MFVGLFFLVAVVLKFTQTTTTQNGFETGARAFASAIERGGVVPAELTLSVAIAVLIIEAALGVGLLSHRAIKKWATLTIVFLFLLTTYLLILQIRGKTQSCGCLGQWDSSIPISILRNALLSLACVPSLLGKAPVNESAAAPVEGAGQAV